jgi:hypothetical protein
VVRVGCIQCRESYESLKSDELDIDVTKLRKVHTHMYKNDTPTRQTCSPSHAVNIHSCSCIGAERLCPLLRGHHLNLKLWLKVEPHVIIGISISLTRR